MSRVILDASAVLALTRSEQGADKVADVLVGSAMSTVTLSEVVGYYARNGASEDQIHAILDVLRIERVPFDDELAYIAGLILPKTRGAGLSFGDRACLAVALRTGAKALTADRAWSRIADAVGVEIEVIR
ncbi:MAG TPA: type II toxin-antitoxin system VapC family toxin [Stellaceae bacterium]|nr:type II toxin-antitoxin system VapC family toxin [Stellaceae bacterium]